MAVIGGQPGNQNAVAKRPFWASVNRVLQTKTGTAKISALDEIATKLIEAAQAGEQWAIKELADRLDGKAVQQIDATVDANLTVEIVKFSEG